MLNLTKPSYVMPFHGDYKRMPLHGAARRGGRASPPENIFQGENGLPLEIDATGARFGERERAGMIFVDGVEIGDVDRRRAARPPDARRPTASSSSSRRSPSRTARRSPTPR